MDRAVTDEAPTERSWLQRRGTKALSHQATPSHRAQLTLGEARARSQHEPLTRSVGARLARASVASALRTPGARARRGAGVRTLLRGKRNQNPTTLSKNSTLSGFDTYPLVVAALGEASARRLDRLTAFTDHKRECLAVFESRTWKPPW